MKRKIPSNNKTIRKQAPNENKPTKKAFWIKKPMAYYRQFTVFPGTDQAS